MLLRFATALLTESVVEKPKRGRRPKISSALSEDATSKAKNIKKNIKKKTKKSVSVSKKTPNKSDLETPTRAKLNFFINNLSLNC